MLKSKPAAIGISIAFLACFALRPSNLRAASPATNAVPGDSYEIQQLAPGPLSAMRTEISAPAGSKTFSCSSGGLAAWRLSDCAGDGLSYAASGECHVLNATSAHPARTRARRQCIALSMVFTCNSGLYDAGNYAARRPRERRSRDSLLGVGVSSHSTVQMNFQPQAAVFAVSDNKPRSDENAHIATVSRKRQG